MFVETFPSKWKVTNGPICYYVRIARPAARLAGKEMYLKSEQPAMRSRPRHPCRFQLTFCIRIVIMNCYRRVNGMIQLTFVRIMIDLSDQPSFSQFFSLAWERPGFYNTARIRIRRIKEMEKESSHFSCVYLCWMLMTQRRPFSICDLLRVALDTVLIPIL